MAYAQRVVPAVIGADHAAVLPLVRLSLPPRYISPPRPLSAASPQGYCSRCKEFRNASKKMEVLL